MKTTIVVFMLFISCLVNSMGAKAQNNTTKNASEPEIVEISMQIDTSFAVNLSLEDIREIASKRIVFKKKQFMLVAFDKDNNRNPIVYGNGFTSGICKAIVSGRISIRPVGHIGISKKITIWDEMANKATLRVKPDDMCLEIGIN